jgi:hypothetical protein
MASPENKGAVFQMTPTDVTMISTALAKLERLIAAVDHPGQKNSEFDRTLDVLSELSRKEGIPLAIIGGMAAIKCGYKRYTNDIDVVVAERHRHTLIRVARTYGIKVIWQDPHGWHKFEYEGVRIEVVPEGAKPNKNAPTTIPSPVQLGVTEGSDYASLEGWIETKLGSGRRQDEADVVRVLKKTDAASIEKVREHLTKVHVLYLRLFDELVCAAEQEKEQEAERGGPR